MSERPQYKPEDVLETEGIDKGRIKDVELAQIGAETEHEKRKEVEESAEEIKLRSLGGRIPNPDYRRIEKGLAQTEGRGLGSMVGEIERRKGEELKSYGIDDKYFKEREVHTAGIDFYDSQKKLKNERKEEAKQRYQDDQEKDVSEDDQSKLPKSGPKTRSIHES